MLRSCRTLCLANDNEQTRIASKPVEFIRCPRLSSCVLDFAKPPLGVGDDAVHDRTIRLTYVNGGLHDAELRNQLSPP